MTKIEKIIPKITQNGIFHHMSIHRFISNPKGYPKHLVTLPNNTSNIICVKGHFGMGVRFANFYPKGDRVNKYRGYKFIYERMFCFPFSNKIGNFSDDSEYFFQTTTLNISKVSIYDFCGF